MTISAFAGNGRPVIFPFTNSKGLPLRPPATSNSDTPSGNSQDGPQSGQQYIYAYRDGDQMIPIEGNLGDANVWKRSQDKMQNADHRPATWQSLARSSQICAESA